MVESVKHVPGVHDDVSLIMRFLLSSLSGRTISVGRIVFDVADK